MLCSTDDDDDDDGGGVSAAAIIGGGVSDTSSVGCVMVEKQIPPVLNENVR